MFSSQHSRKNTHKKNTNKQKKTQNLQICQFLWCKFSYNNTYQATNLTSLKMCWGEMYTIMSLDPVRANISTPLLPLSSMWPKPTCMLISLSVKRDNSYTFFIGIIHVKKSCASFNQ